MKRKNFCVLFGFFTLVFTPLLFSQPAAPGARNFAATKAPVGHVSKETLVTPANQIITPAGKIVELDGVRPQTLALSPNKKLLVTAGLTHELIVIDPGTGKIMQRVKFPKDMAREQSAISDEILEASGKAQMSFNGLVFSPDGSRIYMSNVNGDIKVFNVSGGDSPKVRPHISFGLPAANATGRAEDIPAGMAFSADGKKLYVVLNLSNRLAEMDATTGRVLRLWNVGVAPFAVVLANDKAYVSNWGGRRPDADSPTGPAGRGTRVRVDDRDIASEGSVSVIDLAQESIVKTEIVIGPHACALALTPDKKWLVVASAGNDMLYAINTRTDEIAERICARVQPSDLFGAQPNALAFDDSGKLLFCANGTQNAVALFRFDPADNESAMVGLLPAGWFPSGLVYDSQRKQICVSNLKDIASEPEDVGEKGRGAQGLGFRTHQYCGTLCLTPVPSKKDLMAHTQRVLLNLRYPLLAMAKLPPREGIAPVPVPERVGEPSVFNHVIYIIKENRTYDQVLGDVKEGNGAPNLCIFGEKVTPNQHKIVREFVLLDNTYCSGILSADGHHWSNSSIANDYLEREFAGWPRSYPAPGGDAIANASSGFLWDNILAHGKTMVNLGEFTTARRKRWKDSKRSGPITFAENWRNFKNGTDDIIYGSDAAIKTLKPCTDTRYVGWDLTLPDVWKAKMFSIIFKEYEEKGTLPHFMLVRLPNDHTSGTAYGAPTPAAQVADNDLAVGRIVETVSHSKYWKDTAIFIIEDDPQNGWDHVSGYRTTAYVISPYTKRKTVVSTQYNQTSILRTMELILGLPPMNQMDATATPMFDCFASTPDFTPFDSVPNKVPLDEMNPHPKKIADAQLRKDAIASAKLPLHEPDLCDENTLNRILWRAQMGIAAAYPAWAVKLVDDD